jgi:hypothetical protein
MNLRRRRYGSASKPMKPIGALLMGALLFAGMISVANAQFVVVVAGGVLGEVSNVGTVGTVGEVGNVATVGEVANAVINQGQFETLSTALNNLQIILSGQAGTGGVAAAVETATNTPAQNEVGILTNNQPQYPNDYVVAGQGPQPVFNYSGSELLSLNPDGTTQVLYRPIDFMTTSVWPENYAPFTAMEQQTGNTVKIFSQTSTNLDNLRQDLLAAMNHLRQSRSLADIEATNARINSIQAEIARQIYLRTAALQDVQLLQIANENNRLKREQAVAEEESEDHQKQIGNGTGIGAGTGLVLTGLSLLESVVPPGGVQ